MLIARALMVNPKIMILDEPLSGVDEESRRSITDLLTELTREKGLAVFFSSHDLEMVQSVADSIVRVDKGQIWLDERKARLSSMSMLFEIVNPSYLLFPALVGTMIMGLVVRSSGLSWFLARTVFLGLTLPEIAAAGVSFTFWMQQTGLLPQMATGERGIGNDRLACFTFLGMGLLGYLEQRGKGLAEGRLAAAYAFAGALTILFMVFNPAGQIEVLNLLKGEVIALSKAELRLLVGGVWAGSGVYASLPPRISLDFFRSATWHFCSKGRQVVWDILLYLLAGLIIAFGVIMAGPLLIFGFLVLPALAAKPLVSRMSSFLIVSSVLGLVMAFLGFYSSVRLGSASRTDGRGSRMLPDLSGLRAEPHLAKNASSAACVDWCCSIAKRLQRQNRGAAYSRGQSDSRRTALAG